MTGHLGYGRPWGRPVGPDMFPALSLRQPWGYAVVTGVRLKHGTQPRVRKDIENRRWPTKFRGEFLVHAAKGMTRDEYEDAITWCSNALDMGLADQANAWPPIDRLERGGFIGIARLVDVIPPCLPRGTPSLFSPACEHRWHMPDQYGFLLADVRPVPFTPWKGCLGFFGVPRDVAAPLVARPE